MNVFEIIENEETVYLVSGDDVSYAVVTLLTHLREEGKVVDVNTLSVVKLSADDMDNINLSYDGVSATLAALIESLDGVSEILAVAPLVEVVYDAEDTN